MLLTWVLGALKTIEIDWVREEIPGKTFLRVYAPARGDSTKERVFHAGFLNKSQGKFLKRLRQEKSEV